ncbi:MAG: hypothetical protein A2Y38_20255 [Spirochaetes bacterium GWB1_59_5]|nr:MAG: hypothetical protein A2Y38_20255 [Spirochaetes bacterium GWB1_59_5]
MTPEEKEEFELVAKACGMEDWRFNEYSQCFCHYNTKMQSWYHDSFGDHIEWNPLKDDGDAFRLAVVLHFLVDTSTSIKRVGLMAENGTLDKWLFHYNDLDAESPYAATRLAIWRAAVTYARSLK